MDISSFKNIILLTGAGVSTASNIPDYRSGGLTPESIDKIDFDKYYPNINHEFAVHLHKEKRLKRVYTQNVDMLYQKAGLPIDKIVECHGNFRDGIIKYGKELSKHFYDMIINDFFGEDKPDLLLVMGTRMEVAPVCCIPNLINDIHKYIIINDRNDVAKKSIKSIHRKYFCLKYNNHNHRILLQSKWKRYQIIENTCEDFINNCII